MKKTELELRILELETEIESLEEEIETLNRHKDLDKAQREAVTMTKNLIQCFMDEGFMKDEAIDLTKLLLTAGLRQ